MNEIFIIKPQRDGIDGTHWVIGYYRNDIFITEHICKNKRNAINAAKEYNLIEGYSYKEGNIKDIDFCSYCLHKLIFDKLSEKYGDYCPNLRCDFLK